jgi:hypothetical protein
MTITIQITITRTIPTPTPTTTTTTTTTTNTHTQQPEQNRIAKRVAKSSNQERATAKGPQDGDNTQDIVGQPLNTNTVPDGMC